MYSPSMPPKTINKSIPLVKSNWFAVETMSTTTFLPLVRLASTLNETIDPVFVYSLTFSAPDNNWPLFTDYQWKTKLKQKRVSFLPPVKNLRLTTPYQLLQTPGNGACYFSAVSWGFVGTYELQVELRDRVCDFYKQQPQRLDSITGGDGEKCTEYINSMRNPKEEADHFEIAATSELFDINIFIFNDGELCWNVFTPFDGPSKVGNIYLKFIDNHYLFIASVTTIKNADVENEVVDNLENNLEINNDEQLSFETTGNELNKEQSPVKEQLEESVEKPEGEEKEVVVNSEINVEEIQNETTDKEPVQNETTNQESNKESVDKPEVEETEVVVNLEFNNVEQLTAKSTGQESIEESVEKPEVDVISVVLAQPGLQADFSENETESLISQNLRMTISTIASQESDSGKYIVKKIKHYFLKLRLI